MAFTSQPEILLLSLAFRNEIDEMYGTLFNGLLHFAKLKRAKSIPDATRYLDAKNPQAILITDEAMIYQQNRAVFEKVKSYVRAGGRVIFCLDFEGHAPRDAFQDSFFNREFGIPWRRCVFVCDFFTFNAGCSLPPPSIARSIPAAAYMKAVTITGVQFSEAIFNPLPWPASIGNPVPHTPIAVTRYGQGYLIYHGDLNADGRIRNDAIFQALCGL